MSDETPSVDGAPFNLPEGFEPDAGAFDVSALQPADVPDHEASAELPPVPDLGTRREGKRGRGKGEPKAAPPKGRPGALVRPLRELYEGVGGAVVMFDPVCGVAIIESAQKCAESVDALARENDAVRRVIARMLETSAWGGLLIAHTPLILAIVAHHGPRDMSERVAPLAAMMNPGAMQAAAAQQAAKEGPAA